MANRMGWMSYAKCSIYLLHLPNSWAFSKWGGGWEQRCGRCLTQNFDKNRWGIFGTWHATQNLSLQPKMWGWRYVNQTVLLFQMMVFWKISFESNQQVELFLLLLHLVVKYLKSQDPNIVLPDSWPLLLPPMISSFVVSLVLYPSPLSLLPLPALVCAVLYVGNGFSGMGENGPKNERGSLYTYNNQKRNRGPEVPKNLNCYRTVISAS